MDRLLPLAWLQYSLTESYIVSNVIALRTESSICQLEIKENVTEKEYATHGPTRS